MKLTILSLLTLSLTLANASFTCPNNEVGACCNFNHSDSLSEGDCIQPQIEVFGPNVTYTCSNIAEPTPACCSSLGVDCLPATNSCSGPTVSCFPPKSKAKRFNA